MRIFFTSIISTIVLLLANQALAQTVLSDLDIETFQKQAEKFQEQTVANPFASGGSSGAHSAEDLTVEDLVLSGVVFNDNDQYALISGYLVRSGDTIAGYKVDTVEELRVVLKRLDVTYVLTMEGGV